MTNVIKFPQTGKEYYELAVNYNKKQDIEKCILNVRKAVNLAKTKKEHELYLYSLADLYFETGRVKFAIEAVFEALSVSIDEQNGLKMLLNCLQYTKYSDEMIYYYSEREKLFSSNRRKKPSTNQLENFREIYIDAFLSGKPYVFLNKHQTLTTELKETYICCDYGDYSTALDKIEKMLKIKGLEDSDLANIYACYAYYYFVNSEWNDCQEYMHKALELDPCNTEAICIDYFINDMLSNTENKEIIVNTLLECEYEEVFGYERLADCYNNEACYDEAIEVIDAFVAQKWTINIDALKHRAVVCYNRDDFEEAKKCITAACNYSAGYGDAKFYKYFIYNYKVEEVIPIVREAKSWNYLNKLFINKRELFFSLSDKQAVNQFFKSNYDLTFEWFMQFDKDDKDFELMVTKIVRINNDKMIDFVLKLLCRNFGISDERKLTVIYALMMNGYSKKIPYVANGVYDYMQSDNELMIDAFDMEHIEVGSIEHTVLRSYCYAKILLQYICGKRKCLTESKINEIYQWAKKADKTRKKPLDFLDVVEKILKLMDDFVSLKGVMKKATNNKKVDNDVKKHDKLSTEE